MAISDSYEKKVYSLLLIIFLIFASVFTFLLIERQESVSDRAGAKTSGNNSSTSMLIVATIPPGCSGQIFSLEYRQANTKDFRSLEAAIAAKAGQISLGLPKDRGNFNLETEFVIRGQNYLTKRKSIGESDIIDFGPLTGGDFNNDKQINQKDLDALNQQINFLKNPKLKTPFNSKYDLNCDGSIDSADLDFLKVSFGKVGD